MQKQAGELRFLGFLFLFLFFLSLFHYRFAFYSPFGFNPAHSDLYLFLPFASNSILENVCRIFSRHLLSSTTCRRLVNGLSLERFAICYYKEVILQLLCFTQHHTQQCNRTDYLMFHNSHKWSFNNNKKMINEIRLFTYGRSQCQSIAAASTVMWVLIFRVCTVSTLATCVFDVQREWLVTCFS